MCGSFIVKTSGVASQNKRASLMLLSKEANTKDTQLKSQLLLSFKDDDPSKGRENIWPQFGFFGEQRSDLTILKANFPEDRKEEILQWKDNVHLHPIDLSIDNLKSRMSVTSFDRVCLKTNNLGPRLCLDFIK